MNQPLTTRAEAQNWMPWALAACFALLCVILIGLAGILRRQTLDYSRRLEELNQKLVLLQDQSDTWQAQVEQKNTELQKQVVELQQQIGQKYAESQRQRAEWEQQYGEAKR